MKFAAPVTLWDPSDGGGDPAEADFVMILHVGACPSTASPVPSTASPIAAAASARRIATGAARNNERTRKSSSGTRRTRTGVIANSTMVYGIPQPTTNSACPAPAPTPTPLPSPPAPAIQKTLYTASLASKPELKFTDAADPILGTLTWNVSGDTSSFKNLALQSTTTAGPPHANDLKFEVPMTAEPKDYVIHVSVTSSVTNQTSAETVVTLRVLNPFYSTTTDNALGVFEQSLDGTAVIQSDGTTAQVHDDGITPDFVVDDGTTAASAVRRAPLAHPPLNAVYDPSAPPAGFLRRLAVFAQEKKAGCAALLIDDNHANDPKSGKSGGVYYYYGYCRPAAALAANPYVSWVIDAYDVTGMFYQNLGISSPYRTVSCGDTGITFQGVWHVCNTDYTDIVPITGHSEAELFRYKIVLGGVPRQQQTEDPQDGMYVVNRKGVYYPKVIANPAWGQSESDFVPFLTAGRQPPLHWCGAGSVPSSAKCFNASNNSTRLARALVKGGFPKPGNTFQAHHIQPTSWGGDDTKENGVWLDQPDHTNFTTWWLPANFSL